MQAPEEISSVYESHKPKKLNRNENSTDKSKRLLKLRQQSPALAAGAESKASTRIMPATRISKIMLSVTSTYKK